MLWLLWLHLFLIYLHPPFFILFSLIELTSPPLHHSFTSSSFTADSALLMSCGEKGNDDEFDPIPVLISKNSNQGKVNKTLRWALTPAGAQSMSHRDEWVNHHTSSLVPSLLMWEVLYGYACH